MSEWRDKAICKGSDPNLFDLDWLEETQGLSDWWKQDEYADQICAGCPVKAECALSALEVIDVADYALTPDGSVGMVWTEGVVQAGLALRSACSRNHRPVVERLSRVAGVEVSLGHRSRRSRACVVCGLGFSDVVVGGVRRRSSRLCGSCSDSKVA